ncbi:MAG TPA: DEAD/DEAH box helicase [Urbifossiella sp.]|nr:DEAD/DEAH box helicase [Urbifossiella sp.]
MPLPSFHPVISAWFLKEFQSPTEPQRLGWPAIQERRDTLIAAPTGSGKTLTAFLASLDRLLRLALARQLKDRTYVLYVSPLRALSNDIQRNLQGPLAEILKLAREDDPDCPEIRAGIRTGDTPANERQRMVRRPPHILVTTPESLYLVLTGKKSRETLRHVETVIVDELHAVARDRRGSHLSLSLERLNALCPARPIRIGLSATQNPIDELGRFLSGSTASTPAIVDVGHLRRLDIRVEVPRRELQAVCSHEHWAEVYERMVELIKEHKSTLIFVNTRKLAERVAFQLSERLGPDCVLAHHGSLAQASRQRAEEMLKAGRLKAVVATASLELGIDIGHIDLVCQVGSPRSIATFLQRIGRAGHALGLVPKGRLFALSRDELIECLALIRAVGDRRLDRVPIPAAPLDILAQQIVAAVACDDWNEDELFALVRRSYPYRDLSREDFESIVEMVSEGIAPERGRFGAYVQRDRVNRRLHARRSARLTAITCGGAIPEIANYKVVTDDDNRTVVGTLDEDFAIESNAGDVFLLGNSSWRVRHVRGGEVVVSNALGAPATVPFWLGEAPGRTVELSAEVARLREDLVDRMSPDTQPNAEVTDWLIQVGGADRAAADQAIAFVAAQRIATGMVPTQKTLLFERFFDESGGMHLVIHAPFGTRINRAWGLALRKRFCRTFDFELQASADDNGIVLSFGAQHSFPLEQMFRLVPSHLARDVLVQAYLAAPFFGTRWRWNITRSLQLRRVRNGQRVPPHLQRMRAEDLLTSVFPAQTACQENVVGDIPIPDQPIVRQTVDDCLHELSDLDGCLEVLRGIESGAIATIGLDSREPSPFAHQLLNANPYAFLDDAPLEERRARAVSLRRSLSTDALRDLGRLDPEAIARIREEAWPVVGDGDELHDVLLSMVALRAADAEPWLAHFGELQRGGRAARVARGNYPDLWVATERWPIVRAIWPEAQARPDVAVPRGVKTDWRREDAIVQLVRGRIECVGPTTIDRLALDFGLSAVDVEIALIALETQGLVLRGRFTGLHDLEWCDRRLLARIHRLTLEGLRRQIAPVSTEQFLQFLIRFQHLRLDSKLRGQHGLLALIEQFEGFEAPAGHWERHILPARMEFYDSQWFDALTFMGHAGWGRLRPKRPDGQDNGRPMKAFTRSTPIALMVRDHVSWLLPSPDSPSLEGLGTNARAAHEAFVRHGALFPNQIAMLLNLVPSQVDDVLGELAAAGLVTSDGFSVLRMLLGGATSTRRHRLPAAAPPTGRWTLLHSPLMPAVEDERRIENWCRLLLRRYGVVFRELIANESASPRWGELIGHYRRLEARGEIRHGRFVAGVAGEQFALPEVIPLLRDRNDPDAEPLKLPATDPLNLTGRIAGPRVPALPGHSILLPTAFEASPAQSAS